MTEKNQKYIKLRLVKSEDNSLDSIKEETRELGINLTKTAIIRMAVNELTENVGTTNYLVNILEKYHYL